MKKGAYRTPEAHKNMAKIPKFTIKIKKIYKLLPNHLRIGGGLEYNVYIHYK